MMRCITVEMDCPSMHCKMPVYCYTIPDGSGKVLPNGCDHSSGSRECVECQKQAMKIAEERLAAKHINSFFNEP